MKTYFSLSLVMFITIFSSCKKEKNPRGQSELLPLKLGNQWQYETVTFNNDGSINHSAIHVTLISKDTIINGKTWFYDGTVYNRNADENTVVSSINARDFYVSFKRSKLDNNSLETSPGMINNCKATGVLTAFNQVTNVNGYESLRNEEELSNCNGVLQKTVTYLAPGVGITRQLLYLPNSTDGRLYLRAKAELKSYKLN